jgi:S-DNA-T family DNA segregation ATPase FtsK/SpoIIIE
VSARSGPQGEHELPSKRRLQIGYNRAATLIKKMEKAGIISEANAAGKRDILVDVVDED